MYAIRSYYDLVAREFMIGVVNEDDLLLNLAVGNGEDRARGNCRNGIVEHALNFEGAYTVSLRFDHVVLA